MNRLLCVLFVVILACALPARADTSATFIPDRDTTIFESPTGNLSDGAGIYMYVGRSKQASGLETRRGLMHFNLSTIPAGATITSASLRLISENHGSNGARTMILHRVDQDWGQGTSNGSGTGGTAANNDATWVYRFYNPINPIISPTWTTRGGAFENADSASAICPSTGGAFTFSGNTMLSDLNLWLANPTSNFGWALVGDEGTSGTAKRIYSREYFTAANRPLLTVTYAVPEPTALMLLTAVSVLALRRRPS